MDDADSDSPAFRACGVAFLLACDGIPNDPALRAVLLATWQREYPAFASRLARLAATYVRDSPDPAPDPATAAAYDASARHVRVATTLPPDADLAARALVVGLSLRALAARVDLSLDILLQLNRGGIVLASVPDWLWARLAAALACTPETLRTALSYVPPDPAGPQTLAAAIAASSQLPPAARATWRDLLGPPPDPPTA